MLNSSRWLTGALLVAGIATPLVVYAIAGDAIRGADPPFLVGRDCTAAVLFRGNPQVDAAIPGYRPSPAYEQALAVLTFFGVKAVYSLLAAVIAILLWRRAEPDLAALRRSMLAFFVGEAFCFFNVMVFFERALLLEHLHSVGMVLAIAFAAYALVEGIDRRIVHCGDDGHCALTALCRGCVKQSAIPCGLRRLFLLALPALAIVALIPLASPLRHHAYNTRILGVLHTYRHPIAHQWYELRYLPLAAVVLFAASAAALLRRPRPTEAPKILFAAGIGAMGFAFFRLALVAPFIDHQVWFVVWEETTELLFIALAGGILLVFRRGLLAPKQPPPISPSPPPGLRDGR